MEPCALVTWNTFSRGSAGGAMAYALGNVFGEALADAFAAEGSVVEW